ncbi:MAG: amidohydrolase family protein [Saprospiraceae bacterium]|nr:amidohydrolase family protein [Saprospiraceae bacterium]
MKSCLRWLLVGMLHLMNADHLAAQSILIKNGVVYDGSIDHKPGKQDILINDAGQIVKIKKHLKSKQSRIIDAAGKIVTPGFIDTHAHGDPIAAPEFKNFIAMGVTSIVLGQDGDGPMYQDLSSWYTEVMKARPGVNIAVLGGHGTLRFLTGVKFKRVPDSLEIHKMVSQLEDWMRAGSFGMSTGLEYVPGTYAQAAELLALAKVVGQYDGILMSHMRNEDDEALESSINELLDQGRYCKVHIAHFKDVYGKGVERAEQLLQLIERHPNAMQLSADLYPYTASYTGIGIVFPSWALAPVDYDSIRLTRRSELLDYVTAKVNKRNGPEATLFGTGKYAGKSLAEVALAQYKPFAEILVDEIGPEGASGAYFVMNEELQQRLLQSSKVMVCSDGSPGMRHPRGYGTFAKIIEEFVFKRKAISLQEAIYKMTGLSASTLGLKDRGFLKPGFVADLLIFDPTKVKANANYENPYQLASGFDLVMINGRIAKEGDMISEVRYGRVLKKNQD